jgi:CRP-like cAMP-binding protein
MPPNNKSTQRNRLLAALSAEDLELLQAHLEPTTLELRKPLERPKRPIEHVYFPDIGIVSVVAVEAPNMQVEVGLIGCEGMTGMAILLGTDRSPMSTYVQVAGAGWRITVDHFRAALAASTTLHALLLRYVHVFTVQTAHTAIANAHARLDQRLARWLLMAHDRVPGDVLALTHEFLSLMLGVRRAGVTEALHALTRQKLISAGRGRIMLLDRKGIERIAGKSYGIPEAEHRRLLR